MVLGDQIWELVIGMAGGAAIGAVIGSQADKAQADRDAAYRQDRDRKTLGNYPGFVHAEYPTNLVATALHIMGGMKFMTIVFLLLIIADPEAIIAMLL